MTGKSVRASGTPPDIFARSTAPRHSDLLQDIYEARIEVLAAPGDFDIARCSDLSARVQDAAMEPVRDARVSVASLKPSVPRGNATSLKLPTIPLTPQVGLSLREQPARAGR